MLSRYGFGFAEKGEVGDWDSIFTDNPNSSGQYMENLPLYYVVGGLLYLLDGYLRSPGNNGNMWGTTTGGNPTWVYDLTTNPGKVYASYGGYRVHGYSLRSSRG